MTTLETVSRIVAEQACVNLNDVKPDSLLVGDFGLDSLDMIELVMALEDEFDILIDDNEAERCGTVAEVAALVDRVLAGPAA